MYVRLEYIMRGNTFDVLLNTACVSEIDFAPRYVRMTNGNGYFVTEESLEKLLLALGIEVE